MNKPMGLVNKAKGQCVKYWLSCFYFRHGIFKIGGGQYDTCTVERVHSERAFTVIIRVI